MTDSELTKVGLKRVDYSGFKIDFFLWIKTNPYEAVKFLSKTAVGRDLCRQLPRLP